MRDPPRRAAPSRQPATLYALTCLLLFGIAAGLFALSVSVRPPSGTGPPPSPSPSPASTIRAGTATLAAPIFLTIESQGRDPTRTPFPIRPTPTRPLAWRGSVPLAEGTVCRMPVTPGPTGTARATAAATATLPGCFTAESAPGAVCQIRTPAAATSPSPGPTATGTAAGAAVATGAIGGP